MATYLIDYENVKSEGIRGILQLSEQDTVVIFYSHNADTLTFETMDMIISSKAAVHKYKIVRGGKNALDFQLSTYLGYLIHEGKDSCFYIISKDNGFQHVVEFWKRTFNYDGYVYCFATIADAYTRQRRFDNASAKERETDMEEDLLAIQQMPLEESAPAQEDAPEIQVPALSEDASSSSPAEETVQEAVWEETAPSGSDTEPADETDNADDSFITETIHDSGLTAFPFPEPIEEPLDEEARELAFHDMLAEKIAAAVPAGEIRMTVVENNVTVHQVQEEAEAAAAVMPAEEVPAAAEREPEKTASDVSESSSSADKAAEEDTAQKESGLKTTEEKTEQKKKSRQPARRKTAPKQNVDSETASKKEKSEPSHHPVRRKKAAAPASEPAAVVQEPAASEVKQAADQTTKRRPRTSGQRGRRPKAQKSEAAAFTD